jgi:hypothetical protein
MQFAMLNLFSMVMVGFNVVWFYNDQMNTRANRNGKRNKRCTFSWDTRSCNKAGEVVFAHNDVLHHYTK